MGATAPGRGDVRELSEAEYRTVACLLSRPGATDRERIRESGLPSSTFHVARRRLFGEGWISEVWLPNPGPCGWAGVEFRLVHPPLLERTHRIAEWGADPECVILWAGLHSLFGVFMRRAGAGNGSEAPSSPEADRSPAILAGRSAGSVPVFLDYSGPWARFGGLDRPGSYPQGLDLASPPVPRKRLLAAEQLRAGTRSALSAEVPWSSTARLAPEERRLIDGGPIARRTIIEPPRVPSYDGRRLGEVALIEGRLRSGVGVGELLGELTEESGVYPFVLAEGSGRVILAGLGQTSTRVAGRSPVRSARRPVVTTLERSLEEVEFYLEPVETLPALSVGRLANFPVAGAS